MMERMSDLIKTITRKHGSLIDLNKNPEVLMDIVTELRIREEHNAPALEKEHVAPFGVPWMDSWAANWILHQKSENSKSSSAQEFTKVIQQLTELKFRERLAEIKKFVTDWGGLVNMPPDGGPPEPGTGPGTGPSSVFNEEPPDGGTPEPGVPPDPPGPGPADLDTNILRNNPWILYWFVSINTPVILDMIDAHFTRRMNDLKQQNSK